MRKLPIKDSSISDVARLLIGLSGQSISRFSGENRCLSGQFCSNGVIHMHRIARVAILAGVMCIVTGCTQQCFIHEADLHHYNTLGGPPHLETDPSAGAPQLELTDRNEVATVDTPENREPWYLTLSEAMAIALEQGSTGIQSVRAPGSVADDLSTVAQINNVELSSNYGRVLALNPAAAGAAIEASLARFDAKWVTSMGWNFVDQQVQGLGSFQNGQFASFVSGLAKPLATGGVAGITFSTNYSNLQAPPQFFQILNPSYLARLDLTFEQPLWQNSGTEIQQLLSRHPGAGVGTQLNPFVSSFLNGHIGSINPGLGAGAGFGANGILISRIRFDQSRAEFERAINFTLLNVEVAYWNLYSAYVSYYAQEIGYRTAYASWKTLKKFEEAGKKQEGQQQGIRASFAQSRGQFEEFRANRIVALNNVLEAERNLRGLLNLPINDGKQIIPIDAPTMAPYYPDFDTALTETLHKRPELIAIRQELKARQLDLIVQKNYLKPDLRFISRYGISGLGSRLDAADEILDQSTGQMRPNNAFRNLSDTNFNDWNINLVLNIPLGYKFEHAAIRRARLSLAQTYMALKFEERRAKRFLQKAYRDIFATYRQIESRRQQRLAAAEEVRVRTRGIAVGGENLGSPFTLDSYRRYVQALVQEHNAIAAYNNAIATYQFAKGTIMQHNSVVIGEGELPECAQVRAVEHERERSKALVVRERNAPIKHENYSNGVLVANVPEHTAPSLISLFTGAGLSPQPKENPNLEPPTGTAPERLMTPKEVGPDEPNQEPSSSHQQGFATHPYSNPPFMNPTPSQQYPTAAPYAQPTGEPTPVGAYPGTYGGYPGMTPQYQTPMVPLEGVTYPSQRQFNN